MVQLIAIFSSFVISHAQVGSATDAAGGTGIGSPHALDSVTLNPAALTQFRGTFLDAQMFHGHMDRNVVLDQYSVIITDASEDTIIPGGLTYRYRNFSFGAGQETKEHAFRLAAAEKLFERLAMGGSVYYTRTELLGGEKQDQINGDVGVYWNPYDSLSFGLVTRSVAGSDKDARLLPDPFLPSTGVGLNWKVIPTFALRADVNYVYERNSDHYFQHYVGLETEWKDDFLVRLGYKNDEISRQNRFTAGVSWEGPRLRIGYAYQNEHRQSLGDSHTVDIWLDF